MPQGEETFLYRIVTQLDDQDAFNRVSQELSVIGDATEQARGSIQNMTRELQKMLPKSNIDQVQQKLANLKGPTDISGLKSMRSQLEQLEKSLDDGSQASKRLNKVIQGVDSANFTLLSENVEELRGDLQGVEPSFQDLQEQLQRVEQSDSVSQLRKRFSSLQAMIRENEEAVARLKEEGNFTAFQQRVARIESQLQDTKNTVAAAGGAIEKRLGTSLSGVNTQMDRSRLKTNQMSQAMLQGMQDAQFGVIGVANNIQMMGESLSRQMSKGVSATRVLTDTLFNLVAGPMAIGTIITAVTLLAQNIDKLPEGMKNFIAQIGLANTEFEKFINKAEEAAGKLTEIEGGGEFIKTLSNLRDVGEGEFMTQLSTRLGQVNRKLNNADEGIREIQKQLANKGIAIDPQAPDALQQMADATDKTVTQLKQLREAASLNTKEIKQLRTQKNFLKNVFEATNAESIKELRVRRKLERLTGLQGEKLNELANAYMKVDEEQEKATDGLTKFGKELLEQNKVDFGEFGPVEPEEAGDFTGAPGDLIFFPGRGLVQPGVAKRLRKQATEGGVDQMKKARERFRTEQERLRGQQELLNQRSELGPQELSLFGLGVAQMENKADERLQFQMRIARREKNIQKARLQNQQSLLDERFSRGKIKWQQWMRETANVQKQIAMTEQQWYRKRENLQDQHVKKKIRRASQFGQEFLGQTSSFASTWFNTWKNEREQELKQQGKTEEERRKILKEEGKKRFQFMKNVKIAEASADTIAGVAKTIGNYPFPYWIPLAAAHAAAGAARVNKIAQLSIGDKIGGGGAAGAGGSASNLTGEFTQLTPDRNARRANNLANASRRSQATQRRSEADKMERAAQKMDSAARKIQKTEVTYDDKTAEDITERGRSRQESLNI